MQLIKLYFTPALLLLVVSCPVWQVSQSLPVKGPMKDSCVFYARTLLENITDTLTQNNLFTGIDCTKQSVDLRDTNTPSVCAPKEPTCSGTAKSEFDQHSCLTSIWEDLQYYYRFLAATPDPDIILGPSVLLSLRELMENCFTWSFPADLASKKAFTDQQRTYDERLSLCKVLKGFQVRTITINRVIGYMNSGEHTKDQ
ncbi:interleukin-12 subunit alpha-like [Scomber scombrus]|uniref:Interleukin-12 subunit alpha n=1 Tax=Scomber scombrus TaxID=13677 RepID=A0AAV1PET8_SCOSC